MAARQSSVKFPADFADASRCPGCKTPTDPNAYLRPVFVCPACQRFELKTGTLVIPTSNPSVIPTSNPSPDIVSVGKPYWLPATQGEGTGEQTHHAQAEQCEGDGESDSAPTDRQCMILETMLHHDITSERRRQSRAEVVRLINRKHNPQSYGREFAALVKRGLLKSKEGPGGGVWIDPTKKSEVQQLLLQA